MWGYHLWAFLRRMAHITPVFLINKCPCFLVVDGWPEHHNHILFHRWTSSTHPSMSTSTHPSMYGWGGMEGGDWWRERKAGSSKFRVRELPKASTPHFPSSAIQTSTKPKFNIESNGPRASCQIQVNFWRDTKSHDLCSAHAPLATINLSTKAATPTQQTSSLYGW